MPKPKILTLLEYLRGVHKGWLGIINGDYRDVPGAFPAGTRIQKTGTEPSDAHPDGSPGTVLGSIGNSEIGYGYFIRWDDVPEIPVFVAAHRVAPRKN